MSYLINNYPYTGISLTLILGGIGLPFPEGTTLIMSGFLIANGTIKLIPTFLVVFPLLLITDFFVYFVGKKYGRVLVQHQRFRKLISPERLLKLEEKFKRRGSLVVLFGRHILGLKTQLLLLAGVMKMSVTKFLIVDGATALLTVALFWGGIGLLGEERIQMFKAEATKIGHIAMVIFFILLAGWICYKLQKKRIKKIIPC
ncbi:MAG TPA: VTT domain-containing protein [Thermodesulfobacteriota bacterium]|nr:VTT domain-containing protein [Thermodesulfobacteriota bacterium]